MIEYNADGQPLGERGGYTRPALRSHNIRGAWFLAGLMLGIAIMATLEIVT